MNELLKENMVASMLGESLCIYYLRSDYFSQILLRLLSYYIIICSIHVYRANFHGTFFLLYVRRRPAAFGLSLSIYLLRVYPSYIFIQYEDLDLHCRTVYTILFYQNYSSCSLMYIIHYNIIT